jgi:hypothetical protein
LLFRAYAITSSAGYGSDQLSYGIEDALDVLGQQLLLVGVVLATLANARIFGRVLDRAELILLGGYFLMSLMFGSRGELIAPVIFIVWAQHTMIRPIRLMRLLLLAILAAFILQGVGNTRQGMPLYSSPDSALAGVLTGVSSPVHVTGVVVELTPARFPFLHGDTYVEALKRQLPGPLSNRLFGPPEDTAAFVFRRMIGLRSEDYGYSFSIPSEAYLNFGLPGTLVVGLLVGALLGWSFRRVSRHPSRAIEVLYPVLLATLPHAIRTDALGDIKSVLYPMLMIWAALQLAPGQKALSPFKASRDVETQSVSSAESTGTPSRRLDIRHPGHRQSVFE